jgi:hypothetical protein
LVRKEGGVFWGKRRSKDFTKLAECTKLLLELIRCDEEVVDRLVEVKRETNELHKEVITLRRDLNLLLERTGYKVVHCEQDYWYLESMPGGMP